MMDKLVLVIRLLNLLFFTLCLVCAIHADNPSEESIQDSVRKLLGVQRNSQGSKKTSLPPSYVMDLYEKYRSGRASMQGNTVRSILPMRDTIGEADVLIFNLTGINPREQILQSKLYLLKRRRPRPGGKRRESNTHFHVKIGSLPNMTSHRYIGVSLTRHKSEWHSYDITESVVHCRSNALKGDQLLGVTLEVRRSRGSYRLSPFKRLLKQDSQPFVLIFSEDSGNQTRGASLRGGEPQENIQRLLRAKQHGQGDSERDLLDRRKRALRGVEGYNIRNRTVNGHLTDSGMTDSFEQLLGPFGIPNSRFEKLSLLQEFIITFSAGALDGNVLAGFDNLERHGFGSGLSMLAGKPEKVLGRKHYGWRGSESGGDFANETLVFRSKRSVSSATLASKELTDNEPETFQNALEGHKPPESKKQKKNRDGSSRNKKKGRKKERKSPKGNMCQRKSLVVDFVQLGWGEWIFSPKTFNAHHCSGTCSFNGIKNTNPSNHAVILSLMQKIGVNPNVPLPSCVPSVYSPLSLLIFDEQGNLILKTYPNMIVEKCACR